MSKLRSIRQDKNKNASKMKNKKPETYRRLIPLYFLTLISTGCATAPNLMPPNPIHCQPTKPTLTATQCVEGSVCFDDNDAKKLAAYIIELEACIQ